MLHERESAVYGRKARSNLQDQAYSGMGQVEDHAAVHGKVYMKGDVVRSDGGTTTDPVRLLKKYRVESLVGFLKGTVG